jgi:hypothetical protein
MNEQATRNGKPLYLELVAAKNPYRVVDGPGLVQTRRTTLVNSIITRKRAY